MIALKRTTAAVPDFQYLVSLLDRELRERDGEENVFYAQFNQIDLIRHAAVAYENGAPAGCGAFKPFEAQTAEIKRMFVTTGQRGKRVASQILKALEIWAAESGFTACVLETGKRQPEAIALYLQFGYSVTPNYGQ